MATYKTIDCSGLVSPDGSALTRLQVTASYDRQVTLTSGDLVPQPAVVMSGGTAQIKVIPSDDSDLADDSTGFGVLVRATWTNADGVGQLGSWTAQVSSSDADTVKLSDVIGAQPVKQTMATVQQIFEAAATAGIKGDKGDPGPQGDAGPAPSDANVSAVLTETESSAAIATVVDAHQGGDSTGLVTTVAGNVTAIAAKVAKGSIVMSVLDSGAKGDGTTNDAGAINAAITAASQSATFGAAVVRLPWTPNGYATGAIVMKPGVILQGENHVLVSRVGSSTSNFISTGGSANVGIQGLTIQTNGLATSAALKIASSTSTVTIDDCIFQGTSSAGAYAIDTDTGSVSDVTINRCRFLNQPNNIRIRNGASRVTLTRNYFTGWSTRCIYVLGSSTASVTDLSIEHNFVDGMNATSSDVRQPIAVEGDDAMPHKRVQFNYNTVLGPGTAFNDATTPGTADQLSLHRCVQFVANGNISIGGGDVGFTVSQQCEIGTISGNVVIGANSCGLAIGSSSSSFTRNIAITGNTLMNNGQNAAGDRGTTRDGIYLAAAVNVITGANVLGDNQGTKTQQYGIALVNCTNVACGIDLNAGLGTGMYDTSSGTRTGCTKPAAAQALT